ncbi:MAG TPA: phosphotransferase, partial [Thermoanaerobaculia bacterium]|nr:phosphotransferase [Thermoanaerobaculia bacterium]
IAPLAGDVGRRRYFRIALAGKGTVIGVVYPLEEDDSRRRWNAARAALDGVVRVPAVLADDGAGTQIVEDFGTEDLAERFSSHPEERGAWLARSADAAARIAAMDDPGLNAPFDAALFLRELDLAREAVFDMLLESPLPANARRAHDGWAEALASEVAAHPYAVCHRDYHANNLFAIGDDAAMIDFQDMRRGPDTYDLASLLWERTTLSWMSPDAARQAVESFAARRGADPDALAARLDRVLLQRAWKVCGTFARAIACGRGDAYRRYLPAELALVRRLLGSDEASPDGAFAAVLRERAAALG